MKLRRHSAKHYHRRLLQDAFDNFENRETTLSHHFREPHPFLGGWAYGEALFRGLDRTVGLAGLREVLEVGGGTGDLARGFLRAWRRKAPRVRRRYVLLDLSDALLKAQRAAVKPSGAAFRQVHGDAERLPFRDASLGGLVLANEMIADLDVGVAPRSGRLRPWGLERFLGELHRVMRPGTTALLTEYFSASRHGRLVRLPGHREAALGLDAVCRLAERKGFSVRVMDLGDLVGLRVAAPVLARRYAVFLRDVLDLPVSTTRLYGEARVRRLIGRGVDPAGLLSSAELTAFAAQFRALLLTRRTVPPAAAWGPGLALERDEGTVSLRSRSGALHLLKLHPFRHCQLSPVGAFLWSRLDGRASLGVLARAVARAYRVPLPRAAADARRFLMELRRQGLVHAALTPS